MVENIVNMRELGGIVTQQGMQIKTNKLFRAGNPSVASERDREYLQQLALDEIIDFRSDNEKRHSEQVFAEYFNWVAQPIFTGDLSGFFADGLTKQKAIQMMNGVYQRFPIAFQSQFRYLLKQAELGKTMLYHCTAGKDRTGFASLLLLSALDVDFDTILEDYLNSNNAIMGLKKQIADFIDSAIDDEALDAILGVSPEYLDHSLQMINKEFGGINSYLTDTLGIDIKAIRNHYLES
ncbi:tyrosine-protein phosphatase [Entomomonas asaccharolytica]|uniref:Tyrosine-protein phosphatase n=1 Tax=Entomomonas asaccharolytica TaxID=2785331 RepID=A0A974NE85_9GAMM|nr:tyrosine-protein phosphatase [Entomomonas asaccharolytica]QQP84864.1 tyrosine-protein phosphatase [Entomomonas asaccharolytica]